MTLRPDSPAKLRARFWAKLRVAPSGCWEWTASRQPFGYGQLNVVVNGKIRPVGAHRISWELFNGVIPDGICVLHKCDNPPCVNPAHLRLGTKAENSADMLAKKRHRTDPPRGSRHGNATIAEEIAAAILTSKEPGCVLASRFGISQTHVWEVRHRVTWLHVLPHISAEEAMSGVQSGFVKINQRIADEIRVATGSRREICERFGITIHILKDIRRGKTWRKAVATS